MPARQSPRPSPRKTPANWKFRDGRPRWEPGPGLRQAGWKGRDLKHPATGAWLAEGASIDEARAINAAVDGWRAGLAVPEAFAAIAPPGAAAGAPGAGAPAASGKLAIGRLIDAYLDSDELKARAASTRRDYRNKLKRLVDVLAGWVELPDEADAAGRGRHAREVAALRAASVLILEPVETPHGPLVDPLHKAYWAMHRDVGPHMASGVMAVASAWLGWCRKRQSREVVNWAKDVERETPPGRIRVGSWAEIVALVEAAEALGYASIADSVILGLDLSWSQADRLDLTWPRARGGRCLTGAEGRKKTGRVGGTPLTELGRRRLAQILLRQRRMAARPTHVLWCEDTGAPWKRDHYRHCFARVRAAAAKACPSVADFTDADLRDTAISWARTAGLNTDQLASRTLQSRARIQALHDRHYGEIGPEIADQGRDLLQVYLNKKGGRL